MIKLMVINGILALALMCSGCGGYEFYVGCHNSGHTKIQHSHYSGNNNGDDK